MTEKGREGVYRRRQGRRRTRRTVIRHTDEEWVDVQAMAAVQGISVPRLYERALRAGDVVVAAQMSELFGELVMLRRLVARAGANLNQMARVANTTGELPTEQQIIAASDLIRRQVDRLRELMRQVPGGDLYRSEPQ